MPTTLSAFATGEATMRYKEPYVTEGLNKKLAVNTPPGTYRGFRLGTNGTALNVTVVADPTFLDHVAVYQTASGAALSIRKTGGNYSIDLTAFASKTVVIAIYATYGVGFTTTAVVRGYEFLPTDEFTGAVENAELVVLGTVVVPAAGLIPQANITHDRRRMSWETPAPEAAPWQPLFQNSSFEEIGYLTSDESLIDVAQFWEASITAGAAVWQATTGNARTGFAKMNYNKYGAGAVTGRLLQRVGVPVRPGQIVRVQAFLRMLTASTAGVLQFVLKFWDQGRAANAETLVTVVSNVVDASFRLIETTVRVPDLTGGLPTGYLEFVGLAATGLDFAATGDKFYVDDFQAWLESVPNTTAPLPLRMLGGEQLLLKRLTGTAQYQHALLRLATPNTVELVRDDVNEDDPLLKVYGQLHLGAGLLDSEGQALLPRISVPARNDVGTAFTLFSESTSAFASNLGPRVYTGIAGDQVVVVNATYDGTNWNKIIAGEPAFKQMIRAGIGSDIHGISYFVRWSDTAWSDGSWIEYYASSGPTITTTAEPRFVPILMTRDAGGNRKVIVDHNGLQMGRQAVITENWERSFSTFPSWFTETNVGGGSTSVGSYGIARIDVGAVATNHHAVRYTNSEFIPLNDSNLLVTAEFEWSPNNVNVVLPQCKLAVGFFSTGPANLLASEGVWFGVRETDTNWQFASQFLGGSGNYWTDAAGSFGGLVDTGVAHNQLVTRLRIEIYGSHSSFGTARALGYINGTLVGEIAAADLPQFNVGFGMEIYRVAVTGTRSASIGPLRIVHNRRVRTDDAL